MRSVSVQEIEKAYHLTLDAASMHMTERDSNLTAPCQFSSPKLSYLSNYIFQKNLTYCVFHLDDQSLVIIGYPWLKVISSKKPQYTVSLLPCLCLCFSWMKFKEAMSMPPTFDDLLMLPLKALPVWLVMIHYLNTLPLRIH